jgi:hypothetical protein
VRVKAHDIVVVIPDEEAPLSVGDLCPVSPQLELASIAIHIESVGHGDPQWAACSPAYRNAIRTAVTSIVELLQAVTWGEK